ncbi:hypothetical protein E6C50_03880 [Flavobacterium supellecticarium]|uniref:Uncharacterized protein n=1 Tax=Flavobacterium supellecticarium TaxID=2565924 RepID=A0A4S4A4F6_9FLAO|nr:hypothetical protein [Flavobacterium supellecticarium]THF53351.1 hypothetical protein E6C50_03880 [Flavobacterium supellecticarium]
MKHYFIIICTLLSLTVFSQSQNELAKTKAREAIKLMDKGEIDASISMLEECQKMDPKDYTYPYEIAYAYMLKKEYQKAISILNKTKKYKNCNSQVYQMSGNCYSYLDQPEKAIKEYDAGIKIFPNAGNLYLEKGNVFLIQEKYDEACANYINGLEADPMFPSNYYRLAKIFMSSNQKLSGLIYGEIFMNLERTTKRASEMSELLYKTYQNTITINNDSTRVDFCKIVMSVDEIKDGKFKMPFCGMFGKNFMLGMDGQKELNLKSLSKMRIGFLQNYFMEDYKEYPNVLFAYQKQLMDRNLMDAYSHYLLQMGNPEEFKKWKEQNEELYNEFVDWYTYPKNEFVVNNTSLYYPK